MRALISQYGSFEAKTSRSFSRGITSSTASSSSVLCSARLDLDRPNSRTTKDCESESTNHRAPAGMGAANGCSISKQRAVRRLHVSQGVGPSVIEESRFASEIEYK